MSQDALDIYNEHRKYQIEEGSFSEETALLNGSTEIKGVFDNSYGLTNKDTGNVTKQKRKPRFLVDIVPTFEPNVSTLTVQGDTYLINKATEDEYGIPVLWLSLM